jgi:hypothetical protein
VGRVCEVDLSHSIRKADAAVGVRKSRQKPGVHPDPAMNPHKIRHFRSLKSPARRHPVFANTHIGDQDIASAIDVVAV